MSPRRLVRMTVSVLFLLLSACSPRVVEVTVTSPPETVVVTATPTSIPTPAPSSRSAQEKVLTVCLVGEPDTLYLYGASQLPATRHVMEAIYDGPIDQRNYGYQPVILEKLPSLADGDAVTRTTYVRRGQRVVDANGDVVELEDGARVRPSGCYTTGCEVVFEGGLLRMDRLEVTFSLRKDVTWFDGEPLTAKDSEFAFEVASDPATPGYRYVTERTTSYRAEDEWHTQWTGLPGFMDPLYAVRFFPPLPHHQLADRPPGDLTDYDATRRRPMGWGPFVIDEWAQGDYIKVTRNPEYFRADEGLPYLDEVLFKIKPDRWAVAAGLLSGSCDVGTHDADFSALMPLLTRSEVDGLVDIISAPGRGMTMLSFGVQSSHTYARPDFFADTRVRQAVAKCIDRQALVDEITYGQGVAPDSYLPPAHPLSPATGLTRWAYDPESGRALLDEIGWRDVDGDGVREAQGVEGISDGEPFNVVLLGSSDSEDSLETARMLRAQLADCGIGITVDTRPRWELFTDGSEGPLFGRRFDLAAVTWWLDGQPLCERYLSSEVPQQDAWNGGNVTGYRSPPYDDACLSARRALPGTPAYRRQHQEAQIIFSQDVPALPLYTSLRVALARPSVENFEMDATSGSELWSLETLDASEQEARR